MMPIPSVKLTNCVLSLEVQDDARWNKALRDDARWCCRAAEFFVTELCETSFLLMRSAFSLQVSATVVLCHVKLMSGVLSLEVREQMLCSGLCNSAATSIVYLFTSFLGSDVNVETRCIVHRVNIHILICTLNVRETSDDWQTGIFNISCTSRGFCRGCPWDLENCIVTMSVLVYDAVDLCDV